MTLNRVTTSFLTFPQMRFKWLQILALLSIISNEAFSQEQPTYFANFPRCKESALGDEVEIPRTFLSSKELGNNTEETITVRLTTMESNFQCGPEKGRETLLPVPIHNFHNVSKVLTLFKGGYLLHDSAYYSQTDFCLLRTSTKNNTYSVHVKICEPRCLTGSNTCIKKCCQPGKVWDLKHYNRGNGALSCEPSGEKTFQPNLYIDPYDELDLLKAKKMNIRYMDAHPKSNDFCEGGFFLMTLKDYDGVEASPFRILMTGKVVIKVGRNTWEEVPSSMYCVDGAMNFRDSNEHLEHNESTDVGFISKPYSGDPSDTVMLVCTGFLEDPDYYADSNPNLLYVIAMLFSSVFLLLTIIVYINLRKNVHCLTFLGYLISLLMTFIFLSSAHLMTNGGVDCTILGMACHFAFLSTFSWLSALNFDVYWTFRSLNPNPGRRKEVMRFLCYSIFSIGVPVIIVSVGVILDKVYGDDPESEVIVPRYGVTRCTMDKSADLPYLFGPISFLLACNLILFPTTLYNIYKSQKITKLSGMKSSMLQHKIRFFAKLFMLAGITWIFEVISWACTEPGKPIHWIWKLLDLVNILQAIAIFVVFVCNRKTLDELSEKFPCFKRIHAVIQKASGVAVVNSGRKQSNTNVSSFFDVPGLDMIEISVK